MFSVFDMTHEIVIINYLYHQRLQDSLKGVVVMKRFGKILENLSPSLPLSFLSRALSLSKILVCEENMVSVTCLLHVSF